MMEPRLLTPFRLALAKLFSLPLPVSVSETPQQANEFLVELQSRNVRRRILSLQQRQRDGDRRKSDASNGDAVMQMGSSWLAFLAVLVQMHQNHFVASPTERLFAAQSVLHRVRRNKLTDAIDLEVEKDDIEESKALQMYQYSNPAAIVASLMEGYLTCLSEWNPVVREVVAASLPATNSESNSTDMEERVKGELMITTLATVSYITACQPVETPQRSQTLEALGSAISAIALRIRYLNPAHFSDAASSAETENSEAQDGLVWVVARSFQRVYECAFSFHSDPAALGTALAVTLGALPDTILGSPGGARGRLSVDPRALEAAVTDLRLRGFSDVFRALQHVSSSLTATNPLSDHHSFIALEKWAQFLCVPPSLVGDISELLISSLNSNEAQHRKVALRFVVAVAEGSTWSVEKVVSFGLGLSVNQLTHQTGKKKQSSRSRRRHKELVNNKTTEEGLDQAAHEVVQRGQVACQIVTATWPGLRSLFEEAMLEVQHEVDSQVDGEGPIATVATTAECLLPLFMGNIKTSPPQHAVFRELSDSLIQLTTSRSQAVRCLAVPSLYALYKAQAARAHGDQDTLNILLQVGIQTAVVLFTQNVSHSPFLELDTKCLLHLAGACGYPTLYFNDLCAESNEELEIHRNEIRDLFRALTGGDEGDETDEAIPDLSIQLLYKTVLSLKEDLLRQQNCPQETLVHAVSALAKPLGRLAKQWLKLKDEESLFCLSNALDIVSHCLDHTVKLFLDTQDIATLLPLARILNITMASLAPMFGALAKSDTTRNGVSIVLPQAARLSKLSLRFLPELATSMNLNYEIRGTMRGPSGEDHVGCLSLMRLTSECPELTSMMVKVMSTEMNEFCQLHEYLKSTEVWGERPEPKTLPKSRRILLGVLCNLELFSSGQSGASNMLKTLVHSAVSLINSVDTTMLTENSMFLLCETTFDLASLSPLLPSSFFDHGENKQCVGTLLTSASQVYTATKRDEDNAGAIHQWNRLRGALFTFLLASANPDFGETISRLQRDLTLAECNAVKVFFSGANISECLFSDDDEMPPPGLFVMCAGEAFERTNQTVPLSHCFRSLSESAAAVIETILLPAPSPPEDPRCGIAEAWFRSMSNVSKSPVLSQYPHAEEMLTNSVIASVALILSPKFGSDGASCVSTDGPQSLALLDFLSSFLSLGPNIFQHAMNRINNSFPAVATASADPVSSGLAIFLATIFRAIQGSLPPWAVEHVPTLFSNLYNIALGREHAVLMYAFRAAMEIRVPANSAPVGGTEPGQLLSGYAFDGISQNAKDSFLKEAGELTSSNNWKRLKHSIKAACGGKKKESNFQQKPSSTRWEFDRI